jgi:hypothetical protein
MDERTATATRPESSADSPRSDFYVPVAIVLFVLLLVQTLNRRWSQDYWIHQATLDAFRRDLWNPVHPLIGTHDPFEYYSPYTFVLAAGARVTGLSSVVVLQAAAMFNLALFLVGFRLFVGQLTRGLAVTFALLASLIFWGIHPWRWSGILDFNSIGFGLPYPSMFATALALFVGWALLRYAATRNWPWLAFVGSGLVVVLLSHPATGVWTAVMLVALAIHTRLYRRPTLVPIAITLVAVAAALAAWPYYSFFRLLLGNKHSDSALLYTGFPLGFFAALVGLIALRRRWLKDRTDPLVLMFLGGAALYVLGAVTANYNLGRALPLVALPLQIGIGELLASFFDEAHRPRPALALLLAVCGIAGLIGVSPVVVSFVPRPLLPESLRERTSLQPLTSRYHALTGALPPGSVIVVEQYVMEWVAPAHGLYVLATSASAFVPDADARRRASNQILAARTDPATRAALVAEYKVRAVLCATNRCRSRFDGPRTRVDNWTLISLDES